MSTASCPDKISLSGTVFLPDDEPPHALGHVKILAEVDGEIRTLISDGEQWCPLWVSLPAVPPTSNLAVNNLYRALQAYLAFLKGREAVFEEEDMGGVYVLGDNAGEDSRVLEDILAPLLR